MENWGKIILQLSSNTLLISSSGQCCNHPKIRTRWLCQRVMHPKASDGMVNSVDPDQTLLPFGLHCLLVLLEQSDLGLHCLLFLLEQSGLGLHCLLLLLEQSDLGLLLEQSGLGLHCLLFLLEQSGLGLHCLLHLLEQSDLGLHFLLLLLEQSDLGHTDCCSFWSSLI